MGNEEYETRGQLVFISRRTESYDISWLHGVDGGWREWRRGARSVTTKCLVPQNSLNAGTVYKGRPVESSPEFMPLDMSLNNSIKGVHDYHCAVTGRLNDKDVHKFSMNTSKWILHGMFYMVNKPDNSIGLPCSRLMMHNCNQALDAIKIVYKHRGAIVPGLADRNSVHYSTADTGKHGSNRVKNEELKECGWLHSFSLESRDEKQDSIVYQYFNVNPDAEEAVPDNENGFDDKSRLDF